MVDHTCDADLFSCITTTILQVHTDEVWSLEWSHSGKFLASASRDKSVIIWSVGSGVLIRTIEAHTEPVSALAWVPDGSGFISASQDRKINLWGADGEQRDSLGITATRIIDLPVTPDFTRLVAVGESAGDPILPTSSSDAAAASAANRDSDNNIGPSSPRMTEYLMIVYDLITKQPELSVPQVGQLTSVKISSDSQYALVNHAPDFVRGNQEIHLWDLLTRRLARKYTGQRQGRHIIRSCFGGVDGNFVVSGSEDGNVYVWHRDRAILLDVLTGHGSGSVNPVAWNPRNMQMFTSCSDDCTIRLWEPSTSKREHEHP
ncbi:WD40-repeat-containing domain protein [Russula compacta]|nr:WD40-repeat-containing domain protein [Russula compacta]